MELSCVKKPLANRLSSEWENNREAMIAYLQTAASATHGEVRDTQGRPVKDAHVEVIGKAKDIITTETGEYWRILAPGRYRIRAKKGLVLDSCVQRHLFCSGSVSQLVRSSFLRSFHYNYYKNYIIIL